MLDIVCTEIKHLRSQFVGPDELEHIYDVEFVVRDLLVDGVLTWFKCKVEVEVPDESDTSVVLNAAYKSFRHRLGLMDKLISRRLEDCA